MSEKRLLVSSGSNIKRFPRSCQKLPWLLVEVKNASTGLLSEMDLLFLSGSTKRVREFCLKMGCLCERNVLAWQQLQLRQLQNKSLSYLPLCIVSSKRRCIHKFSIKNCHCCTYESRVHSDSGSFYCTAAQALERRTNLPGEIEATRAQV